MYVIISGTNANGIYIEKIQNQSGIKHSYSSEPVT